MTRHDGTVMNSALFWSPRCFSSYALGASPTRLQHALHSLIQPYRYTAAQQTRRFGKLMLLEDLTVTYDVLFVVANQGYLSWNRPDTSWPNLRLRSTTIIFTHSTPCTYVNLMYVYLLVYSLGQSTQFSYAIVDAFCTVISVLDQGRMPRVVVLVRDGKCDLE
jgi:hypothetical protein